MSKEQAIAVLNQHARSFSWGGFFLPRKRLHSAAVVYQFCRTCDDIADEATDPIEATKTLNDIRAELNGKPKPRRIVAEFLEVATLVGIHKKYPQDLIDGLLFDLQPTPINSMEQFKLYCYQVAGTVGGMMAPVLGVKYTEAIGPAIDLGTAMQITNICRDVVEDAEMGRVYLPEQTLKSHGLNGQNILDGKVTDDELKPVIQQLLGIAEFYYSRGSSGLKYIPWTSRFGIIVAMNLYRGIGRKLFRHGSRPLQGRTYLTRAEKVQLVLKSFVDFFNPAYWRRAR